MASKITYPYSFTDIFYNRDTLRGSQLDSNFNAVTNELSNIDDIVNSLSDNKYGFNSVYSSSIGTGNTLSITTDKANNGNPITDLFNGLRVKGFFKFWKGFQSPRGALMKLDNTEAKPLYIKNPKIPNQSTGLVIPANGLSTGFMSFTYDEVLDGWLYEGEIPTGSLLYQGISYSNHVNTDNAVDIPYQFNNSTGYLLLGGVNPYWDTITKADIEPFGYMLDDNNLPLNTDQLVGAGLSDVYTTELGVRYEGLATSVNSQGSLTFTGIRPYTNSPIGDNSTNFIMTASEDFSIQEDITSSNVSNENGGSGNKNNITLDYSVNDTTEVKTKAIAGGLWLKL